MWVRTTLRIPVTYVCAASKEIYDSSRFNFTGHLFSFLHCGRKMKNPFKVSWSEKRRCSVTVLAEDKDKAIDIVYAGSLDESEIKILSEDLYDVSASEMN